MNYLKPDIITSYHLSGLMVEATGFTSNPCGAGRGYGDDSANCDYGGPRSIFPDGDY